jgi:hypothetical protein
MIGWLRHWGYALRYWAGTLWLREDGGPAEARVFVTGTGQRLINVHSRNASCSSGCPIHSPSDHHMKDWPLNWRQDVGIMERICEHGIGHPDPDSIRYEWWSGKPDAALGVHGCDGCCHPKQDN